MKRRSVLMVVLISCGMAWGIRPSNAQEEPRQAKPIVLGRFATTFATDAEHKSRAFNVELAAEAINDKTIAPNATFSFNDAVGERTAAFGFSKAAVIRDGMMAEGMGGGTCQVASTLHAAALLAGLEIVSRSPHTRPSAYIRMGLDATVAFSTGTQPSIDLKIKNVSASAVVIHARALKGTLDVWLDGAGVKPDVTLTSEIIERMAMPRVLERDKKLTAPSEQGTAHVKAFGIPGYRVRRTRDVRAPDGSLAKREIRVDTYAATPQIYRVGPQFDESWLSVSRKSAEEWQPMSEEEEPPVAAPVALDPGAVRPALVQLRPSTQVVLDNHPTSL